MIANNRYIWDIHEFSQIESENISVESQENLCNTQNGQDESVGGKRSENQTQNSTESQEDICQNYENHVVIQNGVESVKTPTEPQEDKISGYIGIRAL